MGLPNFQHIDCGFKVAMTGVAGTTFTINQGDLVLLSIPGFARSGTPVANEDCLGIAQNTVQNSGSAGASGKDITVARGIMTLDTTGTIARANIGNYVYVHNATKVALSGALTPGTVPVGVLLNVPSTGKADVWVGMPAMVSLG